MTESITVALDAMGGDHAPAIVVDGADQALAKDPSLKLILVGDETKILPHLDKTKILKNASPKIVHTDSVVAATDNLAAAMRGGRKSSMRLAINEVGDGNASCIVSAGNTGALMAMSKFVLRTIPGIERPAIATFFPTQKGASCMLDLGANVVCDADNLVQFAIMGQIFARIELGIERPTVGLLNVGSEEQKGHGEVREAAAILRAMPNMPFDFKGFVEGDDIAAGTVDVIVTDGFSGNISLKSIEGTSRLISNLLKDAFTSSLMSKIGYLFCRSAMESMRERVDPRRYNGAIFLGLDGIAVKSHGGTDGFGFSNAIKVAADLAKYGMISKVREEMENLPTGIDPVTTDDAVNVS